ncbi:MAG: hypothetical protein OEV94_09150 [Deltaproteobacteria bacterium]|nr:hypothetical protein [Deltaproteobacteria bacterium]
MTMRGVWMAGMTAGLLALAGCGGGDGEGSHNPGTDCMTAGCHNMGEHAFIIAGTVYDSTTGTNAVQGATVTITPVVGMPYTLMTDKLGNFWWSGFGTPGTYSAKVHKTVDTAMVSQQSGGSCNAMGCHSGGNRIFAN